MCLKKKKSKWNKSARYECIKCGARADKKKKLCKPNER